MADKRSPSQLHSTVLFAVSDKEPQEYQELMNECSDCKQMHMLQKLTISQLPSEQLYTHSSLTKVTSLPDTPLTQSLLLAFGSDKVKIDHAMLNGKEVHVVYCAPPSNDRERLSQLNELTVSLKNKSQHSPTGLGVILSPEDNISAIIYTAYQYEYTLKGVLMDKGIDALTPVRHFIKHSLYAARDAQRNSLALSSTALMQHVFIARQENSGSLVGTLVNSSHHSLTSDTSAPWLGDFISALALLPLQRLTEDMNLGHANYLRIRDSLRARDGKGLAFLNSLRPTPDSSFVLIQFMQRATTITDPVSLSTINQFSEMLDSIDGSFKLNIDEDELLKQLLPFQGDNKIIAPPTTFLVEAPKSVDDFELDDSQLNNLDASDYLDMMENKAYQLSDAVQNIRREVMEKLIQTAYKFERFDLLKQLIGQCDVVPISPTDALTEGDYLLALLALTKKSSPKTQIQKSLPLGEVIDEQYIPFLIELYDENPADKPTDGKNPQDNYYLQMGKLSSRIQQRQAEISPGTHSKLISSNLALLTEHQHIENTDTNTKIVLKKALEQLCYAISNPRMTQDKKIFALDELALLDQNVCFPGRVLRIGNINSMVNNETKANLSLIFAQYRLNVLNQYVEQHMRNNRIEDVYYPHVQAKLIHLVVSAGWTISEHEKTTLQDQYAPNAQITPADEKAFWRFFNAQNTASAYVFLIIDKLLDHWNQDSNKTLVRDNLPYYRFSVPEKTHYEKLAESFELIQIEYPGKLFSLLGLNEDEDYEFVLNIPQLFACIALGLCAQGVIEPAPSRTLMELGTIAPIDEESGKTSIVSFKTEGTLVTYQNPLDAIRQCLGSHESNRGKLIAAYVRRLEVAFFDADHQTVNDCFFRFDDDLKEHLLGMLAKKNTTLWKELILFAIEHDKTFLRALILKANHPFVDALADRHFDNYYPMLCSAFVDDVTVLNALLDIPRLQAFVWGVNAKLGNDIEQVIRMHFLQEEHFNNLTRWFVEDNSMSKAICQLIASYSAPIFGKLLKNAFETSNFENFSRILQYIPHDERSPFAILVHKSPSFCEQYIRYVAWTIEHNDKQLFDQLTDWQYKKNANGFLYRTPMFNAAIKNSVSYAGLLEQCIDSNQREMLMALVHTGGYLNEKENTSGTLVVGSVNNLLLLDPLVFLY